VANILVYIETRAQEIFQASSASLSLLNVGRMVSTELGATLYAMLPCSAPPSYGDDDIIAVLSCHGADKVILITDPILGAQATTEDLITALVTACDRFPPRLVFLPSTTEQEDLAVPLSEHIEGQAESSMEGLCCGAGEEGDSRDLLLESSRPLVVTMDCSTLPVEISGEDEAEVVVVHIDPQE